MNSYFKALLHEQCLINKTCGSEQYIRVLKFVSDTVSAEANNQPVETITPLCTVLDNEAYDRVIRVCVDEYGCDISQDVEYTTATIELIVNVIINMTQCLETAASENLIWDSSEFKRVLQQLTVYDNMLTNLKLSSGNEGLGSGILKIFVGVADLFIKTSNTFKTNLIKFYKPLKRSEIREFSESHTLKIRSIEKLSYLTVKDIRIYKPYGMEGEFLPAVISVKDMYDRMTLSDNAKAFIDALTDIRRQLSRNEIIYKEKIIPIANSIAPIMSNATQQHDKINRSIFTTKRLPESFSFFTGYKNMNDFYTVRKTLLDMEVYLSSVNNILRQTEIIDSLLGDITGYLTEDKEVDERFIRSLSDTVRYFAIAFDYYGIYVNRQMMLEHNHILNVSELFKSI